MREKKVRREKREGRLHLYDLTPCTFHLRLKEKEKRGEPGHKTFISNGQMCALHVIVVGRGKKKGGGKTGPIFLHGEKWERS